MFHYDAVEKRAYSWPHNNTDSQQEGNQLRADFVMQMTKVLDIDNTKSPGHCLKRN